MSSHHSTEPVAIVGMACRLPGARNLQEYWNLLHNGGSAIVELPPDRLNRELLYHPERGTSGKTYSTLGGLAPQEPFGRAAFPTLNEADIVHADPAYLSICAVAAEALRHGRMDPFDLKLRNAGVYLGTTGGTRLAGDIVYATHIREVASWLSELPAAAAIGAERVNAVAEQLAAQIRGKCPPKEERGKLNLQAHCAAKLLTQAFGLNGPFMAIDAACASSLQALMLACRALQQGRIDMAIAGGVSYCKSDSLVLFSQAQSVSARGTCPFDADADGLISAEGYVALVLKTLSKAIEDGDPVHAVIRGIGISTDGRGKSLWAPRKEGQMLAVRRAYTAGLDAARVQYIEAHATSTQVGDATEVTALAEALAGALPPGVKIPLGSCKANIGHTLETAGVASLVKVVLALQHRVIPPGINIRKLNPNIAWDKIPFFVPGAPLDWSSPAGGLPRRAAVNAFGIGGLNIHVVVDEHVASETRGHVAARGQNGRPAPNTGDSQLALAPEANEPIAVIGMGAIFPGARTLEAFWDLLLSGRDPKCDVPKQRWNVDMHYDPQGREAWSTAARKGGFVTDFEYDWKRNKIPPKQLAHGNPLQFMLLDAAEQALIHAGYDRKQFDKTKVGVVVGTIFGGEFANQLQVGLRLPEIVHDLKQLLRKQGVPEPMIDALAEEHRQLIMKRMPALLDETGSFTSSTLASKITKTFDLMGGALALDAGFASGLAAVSAAADVLRSGVCEMMICAAGQRWMDLTAYETYSLNGQLARGPVRPPFAAGNDGILPGEGVGVVLLKRLTDARRDGDTVHAVIRGIGAATDLNNPGCANRLAFQRALSAAGVSANEVKVIETVGGVHDEEVQEVADIAAVYGEAGRLQPMLLTSLVSQIGHTGGASGMASLVKSVLSSSKQLIPASAPVAQPAPIVRAHATVVRPHTKHEPIAGGDPAGLPVIAVTAGACSGLTYHALLESGNRVATPRAKSTAAPAAVSSLPLPLGEGRSEGVAGAAGGQWKIIEFAARTSEELAAKFAQADSSRWSESPFRNGAARYPWRAAVIASSPEDLQRRAHVAAEQILLPDSSSRLAEQGVYVRCGVAGQPRLAFLFPGQNSQYGGMLRSLVEVSPGAKRAMSEVDDVLGRLGLGSFADICWNKTELLGQDVLRTQLAVMLGGYLLCAALADFGVRPDVAAGHSFGEYAALLSAGAWDLTEAVRVAKARSDAIAAAGVTGAMAATSASPEICDRVLRTIGDAVFVANYNAPDQTVIGGQREQVTKAIRAIKDQGHAAVMLGVPCPYHTPLLAPAAAQFREAVERATIASPQVPVIGTASNERLATPTDIRNSLVNQLTQAVRYQQLVHSIVGDKETILIEVGPQQVLTKLHQKLKLPMHVAAIASDHPRRSGIEQLQHVRALLTCWGWEEPSARSNKSVPQVETIKVQGLSGMDRSQSARPRTAQAGQIIDFDATQRRKEKSRQRATAPEKTAGHLPEAPPPRMPVEVAAIAPAIGGSHARAAHIENGGSRHSNSAGPSVATQPLPSSAGGDRGLDFEKLQQFLIDFVVEETGYPPEVVELDADLEADLGIDSIKKAQMFGEIGERFGITAIQPDGNLSLADYPTLRHVLEFIRKSSGAPPVAKSASASSNGSGAAAAAAKRQVEAKPVAAPEVEETWPGQPLGDLQAFLVDFVVEQTGYPPEVVDLDADLEADLGIDSIKKAQLFGEIGEQFKLPGIQLDGNLALSDFPTLRHVLEFILEASGRPEPAASNGTASAAPPAAPVAATPPVEARVDAPATTPPGRQIELADLQTFLVNYVVEETGYPPEVVELDADLEADLGIDSIKKAQMFGEVGEKFQIGAIQPGGNLSLTDFPTLRHVLDFLAKNLQPSSSPVATPAAAPATQTPASPDAPVEKTSAAVQRQLDLPPWEDGRLTSRFVLRMVESPLATEATARFCGPAIVLGQNPSASALCEQLTSQAVQVHQLPVGEDAEPALAELDRIFQEHGPAPHLFIMTARDPDAAMWADDEAAIARRRTIGLLLPYLVCQRWTTLLEGAALPERPTLVAATALGGDFGFAGHSGLVEGGGISGLLKAVAAETRGKILVRVVDAPLSEPAKLVSTALCRELAAATPDVEIGYRRGVRHVVRAVREQAAALPQREIAPGGVWVVTGGARGITALVARELGRRFKLRLHLIGSTPLPQVDPAWRDLSPDAIKQLKAQVSREARERGQAPQQAWERVERAIEVDKSLREFAQAGVTATYHACDISNRQALAATLQRVRESDGPISGILHGAGYEAAASFSRKKLESVQRTIAVKADAASSLLALTANDPVQYFVGFSSTSGRFGGFGQTDYSLANDLLAKIVDRARWLRPDLRACCLHWTAWDEVGMAARPESRFSLQAMKVRFMRPREGVAHLIDELQAVTCDAEVLIVDHPGGAAANHPTMPSATDCETARRQRDAVADAPLIDHLYPVASGSWAADAVFDPNQDVFLTGHLFEGVPLLPAVIAIESCAQAASIIAPDKLVVAVRDLEFVQGFRMPNGRAHRATIHAAFVGNEVSCRLTGEYYDQDGNLRESARLYNACTIELADARPQLRAPDLGPAPTEWGPHRYADDAQGAHGWGSRLMYHGPAFQCTKMVHYLDDSGGWAQLTAPSSEELAGLRRGDVWHTASALIDGVLVFADLLACRTYRTPQMPRVADRIEFGRPPQPGETCLARVFCRGRDGLDTVFDMWVLGANGDVLIVINGWRSVEVVSKRAAGPASGGAESSGRRPTLAGLDGTAYEMGFQQGHILRREIRERLAQLADAPVARPWQDDPQADPSVLIGPEEMDELRGIAAAVAVSPGNLMALATEPRDGSENPPPVVQFRRPLNGTAHLTLGQAGQIAGDGGVNSHGLMVARVPSAAADKASQIESAAGSIIVKRVLETAATVDEALDVLRRIRSPLNVGLAIGQNQANPECQVQLGAQGVSTVPLSAQAEAHLAPMRKMYSAWSSSGFSAVGAELALSAIDGVSSGEAVLDKAPREETAAASVGKPPASAPVHEYPMLDQVEILRPGDELVARSQLNPTQDVFLTNHRVHGRPLLPGVLTLELFAEAASCLRPDEQVVALCDVDLLSAVAFHRDDTQQIVVRVTTKNGQVRCEATIEDGARSQSRLIATGRVEFGKQGPIERPPPGQPIFGYTPFIYPDEALLSHGPPLQCFRELCFQHDGGRGRLVGPPPMELAGARKGSRWLTPSAMLDGCFVACGSYAYYMVEPVTEIPSHIDRLQWTRLPRQNEQCILRFFYRGRRDSAKYYDLALFGDDGQVLIAADGYGGMLLGGA